MNLNNHLLKAFATLFAMLLKRMFAISLAGRGNPIDSPMWTLIERSSNDPLKYTSSLDHFRSFSCAERMDQLYPDLASQCINYYRCLGGVPYSNICPPGRRFDLKAQECLEEDEVVCPSVPPSSDKCLLQTNGFYPDYSTGCSGYYSCYNGNVVKEGKCSKNSIWDSATGSCGFGRHVICSPPSCLGLKEGFYPLQGSSCRAYYSCSDGVRTDMLCPYGSIFDYMKKQCVSGPDAVCYERACEGKVNGLHSASHATCNTFYRCFNGAMVQLEECPSGQIFDGKRCVSRTNFSCWQEGEGSCGKKSDGIYASDDNNCRGFFYCKNQQMIRSFRCDDGLVFDGEKCVNSRTFICIPRPPIPDCTNKFDGYYTVEKTNCKTFFRCMNGKKLSEHSCPGNYVFDGSICVSPSFFTCPIEKDRAAIMLHRKSYY